ncbi:hypothetical protein F5X68DRAFT_176437 [Plectosphaerella plurivora]|uniref:Zn(2)-C6 fungal-type domain-containing protein n=1 Tax=Plectosphaerella plurivora TaxID=936078 RepID=A0A9P8V0G6_9PEZI|nr:hypothetical protein F5X68DRAFT_176437 [Plectosphaerella plurivora]
MDEPTEGQGSHGEASAVVTELSLACDRCRGRKVKCSRGHPCLQCTSCSAACTYSLGLKPRVQRQRLRVAKDLESTVEHIARTVDELKSMMEESKLARLSAKDNVENIETTGTSMNRAATIAAQTPSQASPVSATTLHATPARSPGVPQTEYSGESSAFAHALLATSFLQNAVGNSSSMQISAEMGPVMRTLSTIVEAQKQMTESVDTLFPHARPLEDGRKPQNFPTPPADKIFACLRLAQERNEFRAMWIVEFESMGHFTEYVVKVCSPGPTTENELIIVNAGLYWLFLESASIVDDATTAQDYEVLAMMCRDNLETLLAHLGFHVASTVDSVYALHIAATYCLQSLKTSAAWGFIATASHICQALGLHSAASLHPESSMQQRRKSRLFWTVYCTEKSVSLRIGRSSTLRDNDITVPRPQHHLSPDSLLNRLLPIWVEFAVLQGRVYDEVYSPGAFLQSDQVRYDRARALISDITRGMEAEDALEKEIDSHFGAAGQPVLSQLSWRADRISCLSLLTLVTRSLPPAEFSRSSFSDECIHNARRALEEHQNCFVVLEGRGAKTTYLDLSSNKLHANIVFENRSMLHSPFVPFTILFCHVIESSSETDLHALKMFLDRGEGTSYTSRHASTRNQRRLFQALYSVAVRYSVMEESATETFGADAMDFSSTAGGFRAPNAPDRSSLAHTGESTAGVGLQADLSGGVLANWFASNQQLMRMMENT